MWSEKKQVAVKSVKCLLTCVPVLIYNNPPKELILEKGVLEYGGGAAQVQKERPVEFASSSLSETKRRYA